MLVFLKVKNDKGDGGGTETSKVNYRFGDPSEFGFRSPIHHFQSYGGLEFN